MGCLSFVDHSPVILNAASRLAVRFVLSKLFLPTRRQSRNGAARAALLAASRVEMPLAEAVERLARDAVNSGLPDVAREAATATGGLPVHWDMGGVLVLTALGEALHYDPEMRSTTTVTDRRWRTAALVKASRNHHELRALSPARPINAKTCSQCNGTGRMFDVADCGVCMGTGWLPSEAE